MLDHADIRAILPQRYPMLLLDRVLSVEPGVSVRAIKAISACEPCYAGLADGLGQDSYAYPVSLLIESFGQAAAVLWLVTTAGIASDDILLFAGARDCVIKSPAYPGDVLCHTARLARVADGTALVEGETLVGDRPVAVMGSLIAAIRPAHSIPIPQGAHP
jgi:3-hydroxyacyl-[acyl-carrier-protein] dehydratase